MWSKLYTKCKDCGTFERPHKGQGFCTNCWRRNYNRQNPEAVKRWKRNDYLKHKENYIKRVKLYVENHREEKLHYWKEFHKKKKFGGFYDDVLKRDGNKCLLCGNEKILIHHIDGNKNHNSMNNLVTLCRKCHPKIHYSKNRVKIQSELHSNMQRQAEMTCPQSIG